MPVDMFNLRVFSGAAERVYCSHVMMSGVANHVRSFNNHLSHYNPDPSSFTTSTGSTMLGRLLPRACFRSCQGGVFVSASTLCQCGRLPSSGLRPPRVTTVLNSQRNYARQRYEYKRFGQGQEQDTGRFGRVRRYWITSPAFRIGVGAAAGGSIVFYFANIETVPETGRRRFNFIGPEFMAQQGIQAYQQTMQQYRGRILPDWAPETRLAKKVLDRLIPASGISGEWELHVVNDSNANAFVLPG